MPFNISSFKSNIENYGVLQNNKFEIYIRPPDILLNSLIWFSLAGYVIEDYDSILMSFIKGVEYWNKII